MRAGAGAARAKETQGAEVPRLGGTLKGTDSGRASPHLKGQRLGRTL